MFLQASTSFPEIKDTLIRISGATSIGPSMGAAPPGAFGAAAPEETGVSSVMAQKRWRSSDGEKMEETIETMEETNGDIPRDLKRSEDSEAIDTGCGMWCTCLCRLEGLQKFQILMNSTDVTRVCLACLTQCLHWWTLFLLD